MQIGWQFQKIKPKHIKSSKNYVLTFKWKIIESITQWENNQFNWVPIEKFIH